MINHPEFTVDPWCLHAKNLDLDVLAQTESVFTLANGHVGWRGNLEEGEPHGLPGTYLNGVYELRPLPYAEAGYGYPESGQTIINVTNGKMIRLLVDDEPFDIRYGRMHSHERTLDFRDGVLHRSVEWTSPTGRTVRIKTTRLVSFTQRSIAATYYEVEPVDGPARVVVQSELVTNEQLPRPVGDPRVAVAMDNVLVAERHEALGARVDTVHRTRRSGIRVGAAMDHEVLHPPTYQLSSESTDNLGRVTLAVDLKKGQSLRFVKYVSHGWSAERSLPGVRAQVGAALTAARQTGWEDLLTDQQRYLETFWDRADVEIDGDPELQQAVRFALFHVLQAGARAEGRAIPAKGLTGTGYDGHAFWDTEMFVLPVLTYTQPDAAANALLWRYNTLTRATTRAQQLGLAGAAFPWRSINGSECSGYWPAGTAAFHVNADVADAVVRYLRNTRDVDFSQFVGLPLLVETARLWRSLGHYGPGGEFRIAGVTGPDEYSAVADDNLYTNLMAQQNLQFAAEVAGAHPDRAKQMGVSGEEMADWTAAALAMYVPFDEKLRIHLQAESFSQHQVWDFASTRPIDYPLMLHFPYFDLYRKQVIKQADLVLAMQLRGEMFTDDEKSRNFNYYERLTVRDSSLSACTQGVMAAELGHLDLAYDYLGEASLMDLKDLEHNTRDGLHIASLAGSWITLVYGFGGMREATAVQHFSPRLPSGMHRLKFHIVLRHRRMSVEVTPDSATYLVVEGEPLEITHFGTSLTLTAGQPVTRAVAPPPEREPPQQPVGREPMRRHEPRPRTS
ncbi:glycosyl hydrolase family 65 protein [Rhodococcus sp. X156]|uniref:glycoside hydrolase family 65 protein n=1 Tax=Rhodococcus sp. X156 TaxID=2499145 RepID=UPI000FDB6FC6|nr:glycosyl hydrolase family 65 protein [Rhodococcus sp. X156]